jgi:hypothetical protein
MRALDALEFLAGKRRTVLLGGAAVILHGLSRYTKDFDVWQDPLPDAKTWARGVEELLKLQSNMGAERIGMLVSGTWTPIDASEIPTVGTDDGMVRLAGLDRPIDVFYRPNELEVSDFEAVWQRSTPSDRGLRLMDKIDLLVTKQNTTRITDVTDIKFLEDKIESEYRSRLVSCSEQKAREMFERFATPEIAAYAIRQNPDQKVRDLAWGILEELRAQGNPFAEELVRDLKAQSHGLDLEL